MNYAPAGLYVWDTWCLVRGGEVHVFHLQRTRPGARVTHPDVVQESLGHAVSSDLVTWRTLAPVLAPDAGNADDDLQAWTGSVVDRDGVAHLFYTMRGSATGGREQTIGLATSTDLALWRRHPANPVIVPDARWYATRERPVPGIVDCRDLYVTAAPEGGWYGFFATRVPGAELPETSVIGCAYSTDLVHWEQRPPAFAPRAHACVEAPDVFRLDGRWYMLALAGNHYGNRGVFSDPHLVDGTIVAAADRPEGPYVELADNAFVAARTTAPIVARSVRFEDDLYVLYSDRERSDRTDAGHMWCFGSIGTPKHIRARGDRLVATYCPRIERGSPPDAFVWARSALPEQREPWGQIWPMRSGTWTAGERLRGSCRTGWSVFELGCPLSSFVAEARVELEDARAAGLVVRMTDRMNGHVVAVDADERTVSFADAPDFEFVEARSAPVARRGRYRLRVVQRLEHVEIYLDDALELAFSRYRGIGGGFGLFVDRGSAVFDEIRIRPLTVTHPE